MISALRGRCPGPLDECGTGLGRVAPDRSAMIPAAPRNRQSWRRAPTYSRFASRNAADRLGDLLVAVLAEDEAVVRVGRRTARSRRRATRPAAPTRLSGTRAIEPGADDEPRDVSASRGRSTGTPGSIWRRAAPDSCGFWPSRCWIRRTSARVRSRCVAQQASRGASPSRSPTRRRRRGSRAARAGGPATRSSRGSSGAEQDEAGDRHPLGRLEREQAAHPVADDDDARAEPLERRDDVLGVGVERRASPGPRSATRSGCAG